jgi:SAM-dependent methyltransferase
MSTSAKSRLGVDIARTRTFWDKRALGADNDCERVDWNPRTQRMRFAVFAEAHDLCGKSVLDVGCGVGDLWAYLQRRNINCEYAGYDISSEMIRRCCERFPGVQFESGNILDWDPRREFDYVVSIGIHNIRSGGGWDLLEAVTRRQFELCRVAAHVSLLTDRFSGFGSEIQAWRAEEVLAMALKITPFVALWHDYLPNDFAVSLYREPMIDRRPDLVQAAE